MQNPVKLPKSGVIIDRVTVVKHILNDKTDPFTRDALQETDLIPMPELKSEIQEFIKQQFLEKQQKDKANINKNEEEKQDFETILLNTTQSKQNEGIDQPHNLNQIGCNQEFQDSQNLEEQQTNQQLQN